jgi:mucin-associated surface protein (MASP), putative
LENALEESITEPIDMSQPASGAGADTAAVRGEDGQATEDAPAQVSETSSPSAVNRAEEQVRVRRNVVAGISALSAAALLIIGGIGVASMNRGQDLDSNLAKVNAVATQCPNSPQQLAAYSSLVNEIKDAENTVKRQRDKVDEKLIKSLDQEIENSRRLTVYDGTDCNKVSVSAARIDKAFDTLAAAHDAVLNSAGLGAGVNTADLTEEERQAVVAREGRREARKERQQAVSTAPTTQPTSRNKTATSKSGTDAANSSSGNGSNNSGAKPGNSGTGSGGSGSGSGGGSGSGSGGSGGSGGSATTAPQAPSEPIVVPTVHPDPVTSPQPVVPEPAPTGGGDGGGESPSPDPGQPGDGNGDTVGQD